MADFEAWIWAGSTETFLIWCCISYDNEQSIKRKPHFRVTPWAYIYYWMKALIAEMLRISTYLSPTWWFIGKFHCVQFLLNLKYDQKLFFFSLTISADAYLSFSFFLSYFSYFSLSFHIHLIWHYLKTLFLSRYPK